MAKGITITLTRMKDVREPRRDDARYHSIWNGVEWISFSFPVWSPDFAKSCGVVPKPITTQLEFPPQGTITIDALRYKRRSETTSSYRCANSA